MMMSFGAISIGLSFFLYSNADYYHDYNVTVFVIGFCLEYIFGFVCACIGYGILAHSWEGYYGHGFLKFLHCLTLIFLSTILPHGDLLLHLGYRQRGYQAKSLEEPFPDGFEFQKELLDYQGYLPSQARGGFNTFFILGYIRCLLTLIRSICVIIFYYNT